MPQQIERASRQESVSSVLISEAKRGGRSRQLVVNTLLLACSILVSLSIAELLLRQYYPVGETILQLDQRYLHRFKPNSRQIYRFSAPNGGKKVLTIINAQGRRGELALPNQAHILVYGDSFISSNFTSIKETFVSQLEQKLKSRMTRAPQVINCGVSGYGPDQESLVMEDEIDSLKPRLVIVAIYSGNDFGDLMRDKIYRLDARMQLKDNRYTIDPSLVKTFADAEKLPRLFTVRLLERAWQRVLEHFAHRHPSGATRSSDDYLDEWLLESREEYEDYIVKDDNSVRNLLEDHYDADVSLAPNSESSQYKRILMDRVIEKMQEITAARSVPMMLVIIPSPFDVVDSYSVSVDPRKYPEYRRSELTDIIEEIAQKHHIPYVNLFKPFREHGAASLYYVVDNDHWNAQGQQLAARLVADYITRQHLLDTAARRVQDSEFHVPATAGLH